MGYTVVTGLESYCAQHLSDNWSWQVCGLDVITASQVEYFAKEDEGMAVEARDIAISASGPFSLDKDVPISDTNLGFNKIVVSLGNHDSPDGTYCWGRSFKVPKYELWNCKEVSKLDYSNVGDEVITVLLYHESGESCAYVDTFGVLEGLQLTTCGSKGDLGKFRVFKGAGGDYDKFVLRPARAVTHKDESNLGLDVCVNDSGQTQDCGNKGSIAELSFRSLSLSTGVIELGRREFIRIEEVRG